MCTSLVMVKNFLFKFVVLILSLTIATKLNAATAHKVIPMSEMTRVNLDGKDNLTQDMMPLKNGQNTIYVIRKHLKVEKNVTVPENCVLLFDGGSIDGTGTLVGQKTYLSGLLLNVFGKDIKLTGEWNLKDLSPDWFIGSDIEKVQKAFDVSIANRSVQINIDRTYNLTSGTIYIERGFHSEDEISKWSRRSLLVSGTGEGRFIKEDAGFMFSAKSTSIDINFERLHFRGFIRNPSDINSIVDMRVFDCRYLSNLRVFNCSFSHCGCVYYQNGGVNTPMQGNTSIGNQYAKNICVMKANECWNSQFIGDKIDDGVSFIEAESVASNIRDLKIANCCVEGFYRENTAAISLNCTASGLSITDNYFEANFCSIKMPRYISGNITGNTFHSRGSYIKKNRELHCIELARLNGVEITANNVVVNDDKMVLFFFVTSSPYYSKSQILVGSNGVEGKTKLTNIEGKVKDIHSVVKELLQIHNHNND